MRSMYLSMRLRPKITLGTLLILSLCMLVGGSSFIVSERKRLQNEKQVQGHSLASIIAEFSVTPIKKYSFYILQEVALDVEQSQGIAFCEIYDTKGESLVQVDSTIHGERISKKPRTTGEDILIVEKTIEKDGEILGKVEIGLELAPVERAIQAYIFGFIIIALIVLITVAISISLFLYYTFISPVVALSGVVNNLAQGDFVETEITKRRDEIGDLARAFNIMSGNLKQLYENLEHKVEERTSDLAEANRQLQKEIEVRHRTEKELKTAKESAERANQYKSNFVANISHEIRTPLNAILGYAQILLGRFNFDDEDKKALEAIDRSGSHLLALINDILDLSKIEAGQIDLKPTAFDLCLLMRNVGSMFQLRCLEKNLAWEVAGVDTHQVLPVIGDVGKLRQILINLLGNAVKFTDEGGVILRIALLDNNRIRFCVEDTGEGIPDSSKENIFRPFNDISRRTGKEGTGLGLSISKTYLEMMGSSIEVLDNIPKGSRFCFELTLPKADKSTLPTEKQSPQITGLITDKPLTALVADDDMISRTMLAHLLNKIGVHTLEASDGLDALKILAEETPDIIFMDRFMPQMDGIEAIEQIHTRYGPNSVPIVMITAAVFESKQASCEELGIAGILTKPCEISQILECMADVLDLSLKTENVSAYDSRKKSKQDISSFSGTELSEQLRDNLMTAAEFGKITELKSLYKQLESIPGVNQHFLNTFSRHLKSYQLDEITNLLKKVKTQDGRVDSIRLP